MKKFFLSAAVMLAAATMSVNAMSSSFSHSADNDDQEYLESLKDIDVVENLDDPNIDWIAKAKFYMFCIDRYLNDHKDEVSDKTEALEAAKAAFKQFIPTNNIPFIAIYCVLMNQGNPDVVANGKAELMIGR